MVCRPRAETQGRGRMVSISMDTRFLNMNRPGLPRITHCPSGGPRESADSRAELGTTPSAGNAHPKSRKSPALSHPKCIWMGLDGLRSPIHPHPKAHPFPSKSRLDGQSGGRDDRRHGQNLHPTLNLDGRRWLHPSGGRTDIDGDCGWGFGDGKTSVRRRRCSHERNVATTAERSDSATGVTGKQSQFLVVHLYLPRE